jgi:hypothetical protein
MTEQTYPVLDAMRDFTAALPYRCRETFPLDGRTIPALKRCAHRGDDIPALAVLLLGWRCAHEWARNGNSWAGEET